MKKYNDFINENIRDKMTPKENIDLFSKLEGNINVYYDPEYMGDANKDFLISLCYMFKCKMVDLYMLGDWEEYYDYYYDFITNTSEYEYPVSVASGDSDFNVFRNNKYALSYNSVSDTETCIFDLKYFKNKFSNKDV